MNHKFIILGLSYTLFVTLSYNPLICSVVRYINSCVTELVSSAHSHSREKSLFHQRLKNKDIFLIISPGLMTLWWVIDYRPVRFTEHEIKELSRCVLL